MSRSLKIYFAAAIYGGRDHVDDQIMIADILRQLGHRILSEHVVYKVPAERMRKLFELYGDGYVYNQDIAWLEEADLVVAEVSTPSLGVGIEIGYALYKLNKRVICLYSEAAAKRLSSMIKGNTHPKLSWHIYNQDTVEGIMVDQLREFLIQTVRS